MKTVLALSIPRDAHVLVKIGDHISPESHIATVQKNRREHVLSIAYTLKIPLKSFFSTLKKQPGDIIVKGDILASRKTLFSQTFLKSPIDGILKEFDLKKGTVTIEEQNEKQQDEPFKLPYTGKVLALDKNSIEIEVEEPIYPLLSGHGNDVSANLFIHRGNLDMFALSGDEKGAIIISQSVTKDAYMKLAVMDIVGLISCESYDESFAFPSAVVLPDVYEKLCLYHGIHALLQPTQKRIIVMQSTHENHT